MKKPKPSGLTPSPFPRPDGHFPTHSVSIAVPGVPYTNYFTTVGAFDSDAAAIAGALADNPFHEVRVTRHDKTVIYDSKQMKGKQ